VSRRVDAHHHVWDLAVRDQPWTADLPPLRRSFALDELAPELDREDVGSTVVVETVNVFEEGVELLALAASSPRVAGVVAWVDLTAPDVAQQIDQLRDGPGGDALVGVRHGVQAEPDPAWLCGREVRRGLAAVAAAGLAFDLLVVPAQLPAAVEAARVLPDMRFVLDHAGKPRIAEGGHDRWARDLRTLAGCENVAVKMSGLVTEAGPDWSAERIAPYAATVLDAFGPGRVLYGSDWPVCLVDAGYAEVAALARTLVADLSAAEQADVFGENAVRWYGLA